MVARVVSRQATEGTGAIKRKDNNIAISVKIMQSRLVGSRRYKSTRVHDSYQKAEVHKASRNKGERTIAEK